MIRLVVVNIRLIKEDLQEYRLMALAEGKSFSRYIRDILRSYATHHKQVQAGQH